MVINAENPYVSRIDRHGFACTMDFTGSAGQLSMAGCEATAARPAPRRNAAAITTIFHPPTKAFGIRHFNGGYASLLIA
jgi:hypothetical protein